MANSIAMQFRTCLVVMLVIVSCSGICSPPCHSEATCNAGTCECNAGYIGDGTTTCTDINECTDTGSNQHQCVNAQCMNTIGSYTCTCIVGYFDSGDGRICTDINECAASGSNQCVNAQCMNTIGSYTCTCNIGFSDSGDGRICIDDPPVIGTCPSSLNGVADPGSTTTTSVTWTKPTATDSSGNTPSVICSPASGSSLTIGSFQVECTATDNAGNTDMCTFTVTVTDFNECTAAPGDGGHVCVNADCMNTDGGYTCTCHPGYSKPNNMDDTTCTDNNPPVFDAGTCPPSMTHVADPRSMTTSVTWTDPTATDSTGVTPTVTCTPSSGYAFTIGSKTVTCTARDAAGNTAVSDCTFTVTVTDFDECTASSPNRHDCHVNAVCRNAPGSFTCMCYAGYTGNGRDCQDNDPPVFDAGTCPPSMTHVADPKSMTTSVTWTNPTATDTTGVTPTVTCSPSSGSDFSIGSPQTVTCTARDAAGNTAMPVCTFTVTVTDFNECTASGTGRHDCNANADCTNTEGGFDCTCRAGYSGNGRTCTVCSTGFYGVDCASECTCIIGASCHHVNGLCTCTEAFTGAVCDKDDLSVQLSANEPVVDTSAVDVAILRCNVHLPSRDLQTVIITFPDGSSRTPILTTEGLYEFTINDVKTTDTGTYRCTATTLINGVSTPRYDDLALDVLAPGRIISLTERVEGELAATVSLDCAVFVPPPPVITWYDRNNMTILPSGSKYDISSNEAEKRVTSTLRVMNLLRVDNGTYTCESSNSLTTERDRKHADVIVIEVPEVGGVSAVALASDEIEVSWVITFDGNAPLFQCKVEYKRVTSDNFDWTITPFDTDPPLSRRIPGLQPYTTYTARVICKNTVGEGEAALLMTPVTTKQTAPSAPLNVGISEVTVFTLTVVWDEPAMKRGTIAFYQVSATDMTTGIIITRTTLGNPTSLLVTGLLPFRNYTVFVTAFNMEGSDILEGDASDSVVAQTWQDIALLVLDVQLLNQGNSCVVTWDVPTSGSNLIASYTILRNAYLFPDPGSVNSVAVVPDLVNSDMVAVSDVNRQTYSVQKSDLQPYTSYRFVVHASTHVGMGVKSNETDNTCDTPPTVPAAIHSPVLSDGTNQVTSSSIKLRVPVISQRNGPISCLEVIVVRLDDNDVIDGIDPDFQYHPDFYRSYEDSRVVADASYVAYVLGGNELTEPMDVVIGSGGESTCSSTGTVRQRRQTQEREHVGNNGPLLPNTKYTVFLRAYVVLDNGREEYVTSPLLQPVWTNNPEVNTVVIVVVIVVVCVCALIIGVIVFCVRRRKRRPTKKTRSTKPTVVTSEEGYELPGVPQGNAIPVYDDIGLPSWALRWEILWKNLAVDDNVLGKGNFGEVRSGTVKMGGKTTKSAIKILKGHASESDREDFMEEFHTMTNIGYHPNVVSLLGACQHEDVLFVALEYLPNGDLRTYLRTARSQSDSDENALSSDQLVKIALDVAKGMEHLGKSGVIHRDLAARNVLLGQGLMAKVSDFGLSRGEDIYVQTSMRRVPTRWLAIESLTHRTYTTQSDVWSYGILLWEIASIGGTPYPTIQTKSLVSDLMDGYRMSKPSNCDDEIYSLMLRCWAENPNTRPSFADIIGILTKMDDRKEEQIYMAFDPRYENFSVIRPELDDN